MTRPIEEFVAEMQDDSQRWFENGGRDLNVLVLGLAGESGEVADLLKKFHRGSLGWIEMVEEMKVEIIDVFHYWCLLVGFFDIDVEAVYQAKRSYNIERYQREEVQEAPEGVLPDGERSPEGSEA